ncbi:MAG: Ig-like domain-containing protein, partial [SAR202 cluster bacterium]|nr:Ig-like domain-containing protein [SAR202 cluster bacterium]
MFLLTQKCENRLKLIFILKISSFLLFSCASDDGGSFVFGTPDTTPPTVSSTSPVENASADVDNNISVTFSDAMNPTTVTTNTDSTSCNGTLQVSSDNFSTCAKMSSSPIASNTKMKSKTFSVSPSQNLSYLTSYKIRVTDGPKDYSGNALESVYQMANGFTT